MIIWIASYPRSGNTFLRVILNSVFEVNTYSLYNDNMDIGSDKKTSDIVGHKLLPDGFDIEKARLSEQLYLIKTHGYPPNVQDRAIYLIRDGRQSSMSYTKYQQNYDNTSTKLIDVIFGNVPFGLWGDHVEKWNPKHRPNTLLLKFEELVDSPTQSIEKISDFIDISPKQKGDIPTFEQLNKINPKFFQQGKKDSWNEYYTLDEHLAFWMKNYRQMKEYGYEHDKPPAFENEQLVELFRVLSTEFVYQSNSLKKKYQKISTSENKQLQEFKSKTSNLNQELNHSKKQLELLDKELSLHSDMMKKFDDFHNISFYLNPYKKITSYKTLLKTYRQIKKN